MQLLKKIDMVIEKAVEYFCMALLAAIIILCFANTFMRYLFNSPIVWSEELTRYMSVWLAIVGSAATVRVDGHTALDILQGLIKNRKAKVFLFVLTRVIVVLILVGLFPAGIAAMQTLGRSIASSTRLPMWVLYLSFPLGSVCMIIAYIRTVPEYAKMILRGEKE